jgi:hypothetical protein
MQFSNGKKYSFFVSDPASKFKSGSQHENNLRFHKTGSGSTTLIVTMPGGLVFFSEKEGLGGHNHYYYELTVGASLPPPASRLP